MAGESTGKNVSSFQSRTGIGWCGGLSLFAVAVVTKQSRLALFWYLCSPVIKPYGGEALQSQQARVLTW